MSDDDGDEPGHNQDPHGGGGGQRDSEGRKIIEFADTDAVIGEWTEEFKSFMGKMVRSRVSINIDSWKKVSKANKDQIFKEIQVPTKSPILLAKIFIFISLYNIR
ncbi:unnamed protein product [Cuscuta europaea]|uniref:Uncharacterized protein n=1 Tax=Cuscuta europaea TaxID=41803 RepID=A0A9P0ZME4_CUSEU|nr:unnamed protein product [Cuscuta europaea]